MRHTWFAVLLLFLTGACAAQLAPMNAPPPPLATGQSSPPAGPSPLVNGSLVNGSFEQGPKVGGYRTLANGSTEMPGWTVTRASVDLVGTYFASSDGVRHLDLDGTPGYGGVQQTFATTPGQRYRVTFDLAGNPDGPPPIKNMAGEVAGQRFAFSHPARVTWTHETLVFTARAVTTTIEFYSTDTQGGRCGPLLDNVAVTSE